MKLALANTFTTKEVDYINQHLGEVTLGKQISFGSETFTRFLKKIAYPQSAQTDTLSEEEKNTFIIKLIEWIMSDEKAFIAIIMIDIPTVLTVCQLPLPNIAHLIMTKIITILAADENARNTLITTVADIDMLTQIGRTETNLLLNMLLQTHHLSNLINSNTQLCQEIQSYPALTRFFLLSALKDNALIDTWFSSEADWNKVKNVLTSISGFFPKEEQAIRKAINEKLSKAGSHALLLWDTNKATTLSADSNLDGEHDVEGSTTPGRSTGIRD